MKIVYVTSALPYGSREPFLISEITQLSRTGCELIIVPMRPQGEVVHDDIRPFLEMTIGAPLISREIVMLAVREALSSPLRTLRALRPLFRSRNLRIFIKNISVFPKGLWLARHARQLHADHLHAHWASTSSTMALIAAEVSPIPWSFTAHRWDIRENNLLQIKTAKACFVRTISEKGSRSVADLVGKSPSKLQVVHVGIDVPESMQPWESRDPEARLKVIAVADFVEVKGHKHLIEAVRLLEDRGHPIELDLAGDGPLRVAVERHVEEACLSGRVTFLGTVPHPRLLRDLRAHKWDVAVLPSIVTEDADEGIPVSLMEAMGAGVPVVSTRTGAIPELLGGGAGRLVEGGDSVALADALAELARNPVLREELANRGRRRVLKEFNILSTASALALRFEECAPRPTLAYNTTSRDEALSPE
jgi:colanic acid/amylovoran biosynthesis glycosyltransferase